jgi:hypothetical protein
LESGALISMTVGRVVCFVGRQRQRTQVSPAYMCTAHSCRVSVTARFVQALLPLYNEMFSPPGGPVFTEPLFSQGLPDISMFDSVRNTGRSCSNIVWAGLVARAGDHESPHPPTPRGVRGGGGADVSKIFHGMIFCPSFLLNVSLIGYTCIPWDYIFIASMAQYTVFVGAQ